MSNVIEFKRRPVVEIITGIVQSVTIEDCKGVRAVPEEVGKRIFLLEVIDVDGSRLCVWSGSSRAEAMAEAEECRKDFNARIRDLTGDAA